MELPNSSRGSIENRTCTITNQSGAGASIDPFSFDIPCDCQPQEGDTIEVSARSIFFFDITTIRWRLCGGECTGKKTEPGFSFGLEIKFLRWRVD